jgi:hypothetical protein
MKKFLLIAGDDHYPRAGTEDWIGCFASYEEAQKAIANYDVEWYRIVDLEEWINGSKA